MTKIEKFEYEKEGTKVKKVIMKYNDGNEAKGADVYLSFMDNITGKIYVAYAMDDKINENNRRTLCLSTISFKEGSYVFEPTSEEDYKKVQLPTINIIGSNYQKSDEEIMELIRKEIGENIVYFDLQQINNNIERIEVLENKSPRKVNIPSLISNAIKDHWLRKLNKLLNEIYNQSEMTPEEAAVANEKLDKIEGKLDESISRFEGYDQTDKVKQSLNQIQRAKVNIEEARNKIGSITTVGELQPTEETSLEEDQSQIREDYEPTEGLTYEVSGGSEVKLPPVSVQVITKDFSDEQVSGEELSEQNLETEEIEQSPNDKSTEKNEVNEEEKITEAVNSLIEEAVNDLSDKLAESLSVATQKISEGIDKVYKQAMKKLMEQHNESMTSLTETVTKATNQLKEQTSKLKEEIEKNGTLTQENTDLKNGKEQLQKENKELQETITAKDEQLNQQNGMIESFREEIKSTKEASSTREQELLGEIEKLKIENASLVGYKQKYEKVASIFEGQIVSQSTVGQNQETPTMTPQEIEAQVGDFMNNYLGTEDQSNKTL